MPLFDGNTLIMTLDAPTNGVLVQDVEINWYKAWKLWQLEGNMRYPPMFFDSFGGDDLTPGIQAGAYFKFQNQRGWRIRAYEANQTVYIAGNLTPADSSLPITIPTIGNYTVMYSGLQPVTQNVDLIISEQRANILSIQKLVESARPHHKGYGNIWYYDPTNGNDANTGKEPSKAVKTWAQAHSLVADYNHDIVFIVPKGNGITMINEPLTITKNFLFVRGMGFNAHLHPTTTTAGGNLIDISGRGVEISGFHIEGINITAPNCNGINITNSHALIKDCTIEECTGHGVVITSTVPDDRSIIQSCFIRQNGKSGLQYNSGNHLMVYDTEFEEHTEHGVDITGAGATEDVTFHHCSFLRNGAYGIKINNANVVGTTIESECFFAENTSGDYLNNGTNTVLQALKEDAGIADAVWDELYAGHTITGSYGALMNDLKDEAFGKWTLDPIAKTLTLYRSDGVTLLKTFNLTSTENSVPVFIGRS